MYLVSKMRPFLPDIHVETMPRLLDGSLVLGCVICHEILVRFFHICQHKTAHKICHNLTEIIQSAGNGDATSTRADIKSPCKPSGLLYCSELAHKIWSPLHQHIPKNGHAHRQCTVSSLTPQWQRVQAIKGSPAGSEENLHRWVEIALKNMCHRKIFSLALLKFCEILLEMSGGSWHANSPSQPVVTLRGLKE